MFMILLTILKNVKNGRGQRSAKKRKDEENEKRKTKKIVMKTEGEIKNAQRKSVLFFQK